LVILVVDDNAELRGLLVDFLSRNGHDVQSAGDGNEALQSLTNSNGRRPAIILLNVIMPVLDGWEFLAEVRKDPQLAGVPVVVMSGLRGITERAKESGAVAVVRKPVPPQTLLRIIEHFDSAKQDRNGS
jgi:CheY-like chemotaxis protein